MLLILGLLLIGCTVQTPSSDIKTPEDFQKAMEAVKNNRPPSMYLNLQQKEWGFNLLVNIYNADIKEIFKPTEQFRILILDEYQRVLFDKTVSASEFKFSTSKNEYGDELITPFYELKFSEIKKGFTNEGTVSIKMINNPNVKDSTTTYELPYLEEMNSDEFGQFKISVKSSKEMNEVKYIYNSQYSGYKDKESYFRPQEGKKIYKVIFEISNMADESLTISNNEIKSKKIGDVGSAYTLPCASGFVSYPFCSPSSVTVSPHQTGEVSSYFQFNEGETPTEFYIELSREGTIPPLKLLIK